MMWRLILMDPTTPKPPPVPFSSTRSDMTRALTRTHLHSSTLIRVLADLAVLDTVEPGSAFAEKLGLWLGLHDAIALHAAHNPGSTGSAAKVAGAAFGAKAGAAPPPQLPLGDEFTRIRASLVQSITSGSSAGTDRTHMALPALDTTAPLDAATAFEPFRRDYLARQREMEARIRPLRAHVREALARTSPTLKQLAALDAVFDDILSEREGKLLALIPSLLKRRFEQLRKAHSQQLDDAQPAERPNPGSKTDGWLARFDHEWHATLLAELDVRLQPTLGLIEAFHHETNPHP